MKSNSEKEKKKREKEALAKAKMDGEGGATSESLENDPRINADEHQKVVPKEKEENDKDKK